MNKNHHVFPLQMNNAQCGGSHKPSGTGKGGNLAIFQKPDANQTAINCPKENSSAHLSRKSIRKKEEVLHISSIGSFTVY